MSKTAISLYMAIYDDLGSPRSKIAAACGYDESQKSRIRSGGMGITLDKIDEVAQAIGYVPVEQEYLRSVQYLCKVGSACECAISGMGACGK